MDRPMTLAVRAPDLSTVGEPDYANIVHVSYTPYDFRVTFSLLMTPHEQGAPAPGALTPRAVREVVLPTARRRAAPARGGRSEIPGEGRRDVTRGTTRSRDAASATTDDGWGVRLIAL